MDTIEMPTCEQLNDGDGFQRVARESDASWRHGTRERVVFLRESDQTYWAAHFLRSTNGEINGLRDGDANIEQVFKKEKTVIVYE